MLSSCGKFNFFFLIIISSGNGKNSSMQSQQVFSETQTHTYQSVFVNVTVFCLQSLLTLCLTLAIFCHVSELKFLTRWIGLRHHHLERPGCSSGTNPEGEGYIPAPYVHCSFETWQGENGWTGVEWAEGGIQQVGLAWNKEKTIFL